MANILIVDDKPENLQLLSGMLKNCGYKVRAVFSGELAITAAQKDAPDLILLDINMPGMSGYEVCERLKADEALAGIPVLFLSALTETTDKVRAFQAGGVDYITKPFEFEEVRSRVETQLRIGLLQRDLDRRNRELAESYERLRELETIRENLVHMVIHDMRSPLGMQMGYLELIMESAATQLPEEEQSWIKTVFDTSGRLLDMVNSLLDVSKLESGEMPLNRAVHNVVEVAQSTMALYEGSVDRRRFALESLSEAATALCDADVIQRVLGNLIGNAIKFTSATGSVVVSVQQCDGFARVAVTDDGPGIAPQYHETVFKKFGQVAKYQRKNSTGLGLTFCKLAIEAHGGQIGVNSDTGKGCSFWFTLPTD